MKIWIARPDCVLVHDPYAVNVDWRDRGYGYDHEHFEEVQHREPESVQARWYFVPDGNPQNAVELTEYVQDEPEPLRPGDTVDVWPLRADGGVRGYFVIRQGAYDADMSETAPESDPLVPDEPDVRTWVLDDGSVTEIGPVERALREDLSKLTTTANFGTTLLASATALAQAMDRAQPDKIASIGREFREHLKRIEDLSGDDNESVQHTANLSTPV